MTNEPNQEPGSLSGPQDRPGYRRYTEQELGWLARKDWADWSPQEIEGYFELARHSDEFVEHTIKTFTRLNEEAREREAREGAGQGRYVA